MSRFKCSVAALIILYANTGYSDIYKCKDESGKYIFKDRPCTQNQVTLETQKIGASEPVVDERSGDSVQQVLEAKKAVSDTLLFKPENARFRDIRVIAHNGQSVVCGEADTINLAGKYVGYRKFAVASGQVVWVKTFGASNANKNSFSAAIREQYELQNKEYFSLGCT